MDARVMLELTPRWSGTRVGWFSPPSDGERGREESAVVEAASRLRGSASCVSAGITGVRRRSRAAVLADRDAKLLRLVGEIGRDAGTGEYDDADREDVEDPVVALERRGPGVAIPVRPKDDLRDLAVVGPASGDALGTLRTAAMQQHHVAMLGADLVERVPDRGVVVEVEAAGEGDLGSGGKQHLGFGAALGSEKVATVDHRGGQRAMVDHRAGARPPGRAGVALELVGSQVAEELHAVAAFDEREAFGHEAFQFDRADLRAVLFLLATLLRDLVVVKLALDAVCGAV